MPSCLVDLTLIMLDFFSVFKQAQKARSVVYQTMLPFVFTVTTQKLNIQSKINDKLDCKMTHFCKNTHSAELFIAIRYTCFVVLLIVKQLTALAADEWKIFEGREEVVVIKGFGSERHWCGRSTHRITDASRWWTSASLTQNADDCSHYWIKLQNIIGNVRAVSNLRPSSYHAARIIDFVYETLRLNIESRAKTPRGWISATS